MFVAPDTFSVELSSTSPVTEPPWFTTVVVELMPISAPTPAVDLTLAVRKALSSASTGLLVAARVVNDDAVSVPPAFAATIGLAVIVATEAPTANAPALSPRDWASPFGTAFASIVMSSAETVDVLTSAVTVGEITTVVTDPPPAAETPIAMLD